MLDHHLEKSIVYKLAFLERARFSELQPADIENKLFDYHLKKVVAAGYVSKSSDGSYTLTPEGRRLGTQVLASQHNFLERAESVMFLVIRRAADSAWLLYRRKTHPMLNYQGFMHCVPVAGEDCAATAQREVETKTGLKGEFTALGGGYFRVFEENELESFTHFTLLYCNDIVGELHQDDAFAEYFWVDTLDFSASTFFPSTPYLSGAYEENKPFFIEETFSVGEKLVVGSQAQP